MNTFKKITAAGLIGLAAVQSAHAGWIDIDKFIIKRLPPAPDRTDFPIPLPPDIFDPRTDDGCKFPILER
jgi:hypothetical protein